MRLTRLAAIITATSGLVALAACDSLESAAIVVSYESEPKAGEWRFPTPGRRGVEDAFERFSGQHSYQCQADFKHPENTNCRGPKDLYLAFRPSLNKPEFVATFSWHGSSDRTHTEFVRLVTEFRSYMETAVGREHVRLQGAN